MRKGWRGEEKERGRKREREGGREGESPTSLNPKP
jgi:hypothetical protein